MAKKTKKSAKTTARKPSKIRRKSAAKPTTLRSKVAPSEGPLTLAEATAVVHAARPQLAVKAATKTVAPPTSPASVGAEQKALKKKQADEIARRTEEYKAVMRLLKARGARPPADKPTGRKTPGDPVAKGPSFSPLQVLAEGDSWFDYPVPLFGGGIIPRLATRMGVPILNLAAAGDEARAMMGVEQARKLAKQLNDGCPAGGHWELLLFSGGGNDIVGDQMALWVSQWDPSKPPPQHLIASHFDAALNVVRSAYENLIALRNQLSPTTHLVFHAYDYAIPDGRGICYMGPWLKPTFDFRSFPSRAAAQEVVKMMIDKFAAMLANLVTDNTITFIKTPGTLSPVPSSWHNELHPSKDGFNTFAGIFHERIRQLFPGRVA